MKVYQQMISNQVPTLLQFLKKKYSKNKIVLGNLSRLVQTSKAIGPIDFICNFFKNCGASNTNQHEINGLSQLSLLEINVLTNLFKCGIADVVNESDNLNNDSAIVSSCVKNVINTHFQFTNEQIDFFKNKSNSTFISIFFNRQIRSVQKIVSNYPSPFILDQIKYQFVKPGSHLVGILDHSTVVVSIIQKETEFTKNHNGFEYFLQDFEKKNKMKLQEYRLQIIQSILKKY